MLLNLLTTFISLYFPFSISDSYNVGNKVEYAINLILEGKIDESIQHLKTAANTNNVVAQFYLAQCYEYGIGVKADSTLAFSMYRRAAERGFPPAMSELAKCFREGIGVSQNIERASEWQSRFEKKNFNDTLPHITEIYTANQNNTSLQATNQKEEGKNILENRPATAEKSVSNSQINLHSTNNLPVKSTASETVISSDVDIDIPSGVIKADNVFALIIANENYQDVAAVSNALNDGEVMARYCNKVLGLPTENIHFVKNATLNNIKREINLFKQIATAYNGAVSFIVYYAGHGIPDEKTHNAYLMPVDGFTSDLSTCFSLSELYKSFGEMTVKKTIIFMDACFSGSIRGDGMLYSARSVKLRPKPTIPLGKTLVISSAQGDETAFPYEEQNHGLFTYFLLKKLKDSKGHITLDELFDYIKGNVVKKSLIVNSKAQTPVVTPSNEIMEEWYNWKIN